MCWSWVGSSDYRKAERRIFPERDNSQQIPMCTHFHLSEGFRFWEPHNGTCRGRPCSFHAFPSPRQVYYILNLSWKWKTACWVFGKWSFWGGAPCHVTAMLFNVSVDVDVTQGMAAVGRPLVTRRPWSILFRSEAVLSPGESACGAAGSQTRGTSPAGCWPAFGPGHQGGPVFGAIGPSDVSKTFV